ncbi:MAG TPA: peptidoglycan DD-metalloendopeptidase family protein [Gemmatimonadales bacterium]|nr:peptidoglycan DD-metalloendopeptidase family protein [Gemmatimonadales bacterium]
MGRFKLPFAFAVILTAIFFAESGKWPWRRFDVPGPAPAGPALAGVASTPAVQPVRFHEVTDTLRRGETLSALFARHGIRNLDIRAIAPKLDPRRLRAGMVFNFRREANDSEPSHITVRTDAETRLQIRRVAEGWDAERETIEWRPEIVRVEGKIDASLYEALDAIPDSLLGGAERTRLAWEIADVYAWQIDFTRDLQPGDTFQVLLERLVSAEGEVRFGRVLASDLSVAGRAYTAFRFGGEAGRNAFYDAKGVSLRLAFLRAPLEFRRISSNFTRGRKHPILGYVRKHEGTDYAAASGTPVMAAGDGVVLRAGHAGGYGNLVEVRHRNGITTRYGHLRSFARGIRAGAHVSQGQTIGYVGMTGLATGPHLHYEFRVNGVAKDSRSVNLGGGLPLTGRERAAFEAERARLAAQLYGQAPVGGAEPLVAMHEADPAIRSN